MPMTSPLQKFVALSAFGKFGAACDLGGIVVGLYLLAKIPLYASVMIVCFSVLLLVQIYGAKRQRR